MKYGLLVHKPTSNLGDDIQSYAIEQFLPSVDYLVNREQINKFKGDDEEPVAVVMAAWWMWHKWNWPPSKYVYPHFVGFHYSDNEVAKQAGCPVDYLFMTGIGADYLNAYGPVGCRDYFTRDKMRECGVKAEFSGCITLTLPQQEKKEVDDYIVIVDVQKDVEARIRKEAEAAGIRVVKVGHDVNSHENSKRTWEERSEIVKERLTLYQNAKCVVTRRLHCALPCLAMGVPTLLVIHTLESIRFIPYYDWLHCCTPRQYLDKEIDYDITNPPANKPDYLETREALIKSIQDFVNETKDMHKTADQLDRLKFKRKKVSKWRVQKLRETRDIWEKELKKENKEIQDLRNLVIERRKKIQKMIPDNAPVEETCLTPPTKKNLKARVVNRSRICLHDLDALLLEEKIKREANLENIASNKVVNKNLFEKIKSRLGFKNAEHIKYLEMVMLEDLRQMRFNYDMIKKYKNVISIQDRVLGEE